MNIGSVLFTTSPVEPLNKRSLHFLCRTSQQTTDCVGCLWSSRQLYVHKFEITFWMVWDFLGSYTCRKLQLLSGWFVIFWSVISTVVCDYFRNCTTHKSLLNFALNSILSKRLSRNNPWYAGIVELCSQPLSYNAISSSAYFVLYPTFTKVEHLNSLIKNARKFRYFA